MDFIITLSSKKSAFTPDKNIRLTGVTEQYAEGYKKALEEHKIDYNIYLDPID